MKNLKNEMKGIGFIITVALLISQVLTICTCNGQKSTSELPITESQTDSSSYFGKHAKQMLDAMECVTSRIDGVALASCHPQNLLTC